MITSMTGFGRGDEVRDGFACQVEIRSLNHRFLDVVLKLPRGLSLYEDTAKEIVRKHITRGRISLSVNLSSEQNPDLGLRIDAEAAQKYKRLLEMLRDTLQLEGPITIDHILHFSEVLTLENSIELPEQAWECVQCAIERAVLDLNEMRRREGVEISTDLMSRLQILDVSLNEIEARSLARRKEEFNKLYQRLQEYIIGREVDPQRLEQEVALLADRVDSTEECIRFRSHNKLFLEAMQASEPSGRKLNFLLQEMNREANTIGAKANDATIAHLVVKIKEEVEKLRAKLWSN